MSFVFLKKHTLFVIVFFFSSIGRRDSNHFKQTQKKRTNTLTQITRFHMIVTQARYKTYSSQDSRPEEKISKKKKNWRKNVKNTKKLVPPQALCHSAYEYDFWFCHHRKKNKRREIMKHTVFINVAVWVCACKIVNVCIVDWLKRWIYFWSTIKPKRNLSFFCFALVPLHFDPTKH